MKAPTSIESLLLSLVPLQQTLQSHPLYGAVRTLPQLRVFMAHHVYPVWDFMSLLKSLQAAVAPAQVPWAPQGNTALRRFINEIVLGEECDEGPPDAEGRSTWLSHFELYAMAMREVGANPAPAQRLAQLASAHGLEHALTQVKVPLPAREFMRSTFGFIASGKPHVVAAAFAFGREEPIPDMFRALLARLGTRRDRAPAFHYYLERHIHLDEGSHGPLALRLVDELVGGDAQRLAEAQAAAQAALRARIALWDGVLAALPGR